MARKARHGNERLINYSLGCGQLIFYSNNDNEQTEDVFVSASVILLLPFLSHSAKISEVSNSMSLCI